MKRTNLVIKSLVAFSTISMFVWISFSRPYVAKPSPIVLLYEINPLYLPGFLAILIALLLILFKDYENKTGDSILLPLLVVLIATMYIQLPPLALFKYPFSDHPRHAIPIYWILRNHNINWPEHLAPSETISPQLFIASWMMIINNHSIFMLHEVCLALLPTLTIIYMYLLSKCVGFSRIESSLIALFALSLSYLLYYFVRATYTIPIYILVNYLLLYSILRRRLIIPFFILALSFTSMDPAFVLLSIVASIVFPVVYVIWILILRIRGITIRVNIRTILLVVIMIIILFISYTILIFHRLPDQPRNLYYGIIQHIWNTLMKALNEPSMLTPKQVRFWGKPTALTFNEYYETLYRLKVFTRAASIVLGALTAFLILICVRISDPNSITRLSFVLSHFLITSMVCILKGYGVTFAPWSALMCYMLLIVLRSSSWSREKSILSSSVLAIISFLTILSVINVPLVTMTSGQRVSVQDLELALWLGKFSPQHFYVWTPFAGYDLDRIAYILGNYVYEKGWYIPYKGLTEETIDVISHFDNVVLARTMIYKFFEKTNAIWSLPEFLTTLMTRLSKDHILAYASSSGVYIIDCSVWIKP